METAAIKEGVYVTAGYITLFYLCIIGQVLAQKKLLLEYRSRGERVSSSESHLRHAQRPPPNHEPHVLRSTTGGIKLEVRVSSCHRLEAPPENTPSPAFSGRLGEELETTVTIRSDPVVSIAASLLPKVHEMITIELALQSAHPCMG